MHIDAMQAHQFNSYRTYATRKDSKYSIIPFIGKLAVFSSMTIFLKRVVMQKVLLKLERTKHYTHTRHTMWAHNENQNIHERRKGFTFFA